VTDPPRAFRAGIVDKLAAAIREAISDPAIVQTLVRTARCPQVSPAAPDELKRFVEKRDRPLGQDRGKGRNGGSE